MKIIYVHILKVWIMSWRSSTHLQGPEHVLKIFYTSWRSSKHLEDLLHILKIFYTSWRSSNSLKGLQHVSKIFYTSWKHLTLLKIFYTTWKSDFANHLQLPESPSTHLEGLSVSSDGLVKNWSIQMLKIYKNCWRFSRSVEDLQKC